MKEMKEMEEIRYKMEFQKRIIEKSTALFSALSIGFAVYAFMFEYNFIIGLMFFLSAYSAFRHWNAYKATKRLERFYNEVKEKVQKEEMTVQEGVQKMILKLRRK